MKANIDDLVNRAPDGEILLDAGQHRYFFRGNWKLQVENVLDSYHVPFSHASTVNKKGEQFSRREGDDTGAKVIDEALPMAVPPRDGGYLKTRFRVAMLGEKAATLP